MSAASIATAAGGVDGRRYRAAQTHAAGRIDHAGAARLSMDAITIQILRNKVASLVEEMHCHFYRPGSERA
jgi:hypothetical protein